MPPIKTIAIANTRMFKTTTPGPTFPGNVQTPTALLITAKRRK